MALFAGYNLTHLPENGTYDVGAINGAFMMGRRVVFEAIAEKTTGESIELRAESEAAPLPLRPRVEDENLKLKGNPTGELKADSLALIANRSSVTAAGAQPRHIFDERFFMYGDDLDLCIRVANAGYRIVYDGSVRITHLKGVSVAKDYEGMSQAIFDTNRDVYLKHFNPKNSRWVRWKYILAFGLWKHIARWRAKLRGHEAVRPL
jgi:GT2 family glycosyltransferase